MEGVGLVVNADVEEACPALDDTQPTGVPQQEGGDHEDPANEDVDLETELPGQDLTYKEKTIFYCFHVASGFNWIKLPVYIEHHK